MAAASSTTRNDKRMLIKQKLCNPQLILAKHFCRLSHRAGSKGRQIDTRWPLHPVFADHSNSSSCPRSKEYQLLQLQAASAILFILCSYSTVL